MLREDTLFGVRDRAAEAMDRLRTFEAAALRQSPEGYYVAFSGGKDSIVTLDLVRRAGVKHTAHFHLTTVDPPELLAFVREHYADVRRDRPPISMFRLIIKRMMPPTRKVKYCCEVLKERGGDGRMVVTGVRWAESQRRSQRRMVESCYRSARRTYLHPIIDWSGEDVWEYIREQRMPYCRLYDEGHKRIGCIGCPSASVKQRLADFSRWPKFEAMYMRAFEIAAKGNINRLGDRIITGGTRWKDGQAMFRWWMKENRCEKDDPDQGVLFE